MSVYIYLYIYTHKHIHVYIYRHIQAHMHSSTPCQKRNLRDVGQPVEESEESWAESMFAVHGFGSTLNPKLHYHRVHTLRSLFLNSSRLCRLAVF